MFLKRIANLPKLSGLHDSANSFEVEADAITREAADLLQQKSPLLGITHEMDPHPVAPAAVPGQPNFVPVIPTPPISQQNRIRGSIENSYSCFYYPHCKSFVCGGRKAGLHMCKFVKSGQIVLDNVDEFLEENVISKRQQKAARARERRGAKRRRNLLEDD